MKSPAIKLALANNTHLAALASGSDEARKCIVKGSLGKGLWAVMYENGCPDEVRSAVLKETWDDHLINVIRRRRAAQAYYAKANATRASLDIVAKALTLLMGVEFKVEGGSIKTSEGIFDLESAGALMDHANALVVASTAFSSSPKYVKSDLVVTIHWSESDKVEAGDFTFDDIASTLLVASMYAPVDGSYHKTKFTIETKDGEQSYCGRLDLTSNDSSLERHIIEGCEYRLGHKVGERFGPKNDEQKGALEFWLDIMKG